MSLAGRRFYEDLSRRELDPRTVNAIMYRNRAVAAAVRRPGGRILEVGPGEGWLTRLLLDTGHAVTAVDMAGGWLARKEVSGAGRAQASMTALPFAAGTFDAVIAAEVIEHIPDFERALAEGARVLKRGGRLVVTVPYREELTFETDPETGERRERNGHLHSFDEAGLGAAIERAGLRLRDRFVGPTRLTREVIYRVGGGGLDPLLRSVDRLCYRGLRVGDTWMLMAARRV